MAACLLTQIFSFAALANAYEEFDLIDEGTPACKDCAENNNAPPFEQTRVAMHDTHGQAPAMIGSDPVVEAPPAIGGTAPVVVEPMQQTVDANQIPAQPFDNQQPFINQQGFEQQTYVDQQQFGESHYPQSGGLGESAFEYPNDAQPMSYQPASDIPMGYDQTGFEQHQYDQAPSSQSGTDQGFNSGFAQVNYDSQYRTQNFGQAIVSEMPVDGMPVEQYPTDQTYSSYRAMPSAAQQQNFAQTYTSSASASSGNVQPGLAQQKAVRAAQSGIQGHLGGGLGGAKYEGVGWSNHSAQNAIHSCCYWGVRPTAQIGVSKGKNGFWYACVLYY